MKRFRSIRMLPAPVILLLLSLPLVITVSGCSEAQTSEQEFKEGLDEAIKAAERGKELMKDARKPSK